MMILNYQLIRKKIKTIEFIDGLLNFIDIHDKSYECHIEALSHLRTDDPVVYFYVDDLLDRIQRPNGDFYKVTLEYLPVDIKNPVSVTKYILSGISPIENEGFDRDAEEPEDDEPEDEEEE